MMMERVSIEHLVTCYVEPSSVHDISEAEKLSERGIKLARILGDADSEVRFLRTRMVAASHYGSDEDGSSIMVRRVCPVARKPVVHFERFRARFGPR